MLDRYVGTTEEASNPGLCGKILTGDCEGSMTLEGSLTRLLQNAYGGKIAVVKENSPDPDFEELPMVAGTKDDNLQ